MKEKKSLINLLVKAHYLKDYVFIKQVIIKPNKYILDIEFHQSTAQVTLEVYKSDFEKKFSPYVKKINCTCKSSVINLGKDEYITCPHEWAIINWLVDNYSIVEEKINQKIKEVNKNESNISKQIKTEIRKD